MGYYGLLVFIHFEPVVVFQISKLNDLLYVFCLYVCQLFNFTTYHATVQMWEGVFRPSTLFMFVCLFGLV